MCGRFNVIDNPELQALLNELGIDLGLPTRTNVAPTEIIAMVREESPRQLAQVRWWLTPRWAKQVDQKYSMFNARAEGLAKSRAYGEPFRRRRGIVPVSSFIEWKKEAGGKQPYVIEAQGEALALAAVWDRWEGDGEVIESCALVTVDAAPEFERIHNRMPLILFGEERDHWLDVSAGIAADDPLFQPLLKRPMRATPVSPGVNNARNKEPSLLEATGDPLCFGTG
jgi:putative SOS response-associated peptidase YedK